MARGVFTLSLDFELIWGELDLRGPEALREACERERTDVFDRLLELLGQFEIEATWCVVGHLMLDSCAAAGGRTHPEIVRPQHAWHHGDWLRDDPASDESASPTFYARSLLERLLASPVPQEVGCHSFSHVIYGDPGCSEDAARTDLDACVRAARELGVTLRSFAFPRNRVGHLDVLREAGFTCFRGPEPTWHGGGGRGALARAGHIVDVLTAREAPLVEPRSVDGLIDIPASMMYFPMHGVRRHLPVSRRVKRMVDGVRRAARDGGVFHLWFHPTNLVYEREAAFDGLRATLSAVADARRDGSLEVLPMARLAERVAHREPGGKPPAYSPG